MQTNKKVLLSSGGMDSYLLACEPELIGATHLFVDIGQKYVAKERIAAKLVAKLTNSSFVEMQTAQIGAMEHRSGIIPFRNAEMILCAAQHGNEIYFGVIADEINSDKSVEFCNAMERVLNISHKKQYWTEGKEFRIHTPFRLVSKSDLVKQYLNRETFEGDCLFGLSRTNRLDNLLQTVSCYDAGNSHCGRCPSCFKRWVALVNAFGYNDWMMWGFESNPYTWKTNMQWKVDMSNYAIGRKQELLSALNIAAK